MKTVKNIIKAVLFFVLMQMQLFAQKNVNILQLADTSKVFATNKQISDFIDIKTYPAYLFKLNHAVTAMQTVGYALRNGWCDTIGKQQAVLVGSGLYVPYTGASSNVDLGAQSLTTSTSGNAITGNSTSGLGISGNSVSGVGVDGRATSGDGIYGYSKTGYAGNFKGRLITDTLLVRYVPTGNIASSSTDKMLLQDTLTGIVKRVTTPPILWTQVDGVLKSTDPNAKVSIGTPDTTLTSLYVNGDYYIKGGNGDVDGSNTLTALDALYVKLALAGHLKLTPSQYARADLFGTGNITPFEPWFIQKMVILNVGSFNYNRDFIKSKLGTAAYLMPKSSSYTFTVSGDTIKNLNELGYGYGMLSYSGDIPIAAMQITNTGNVGINNGNPTEKLDVVGTIKTGTIAKLSLDTVTAIRLTGNATVWKDIEGAFSTGLNGGSIYPIYVVDSGYYTFTVDTTGPSICKQYFPAIQINHDFKTGATLYPHVHYKHETAKGTPTFIVKYRWKNIGQAPTAWKWCKMNNTTGTTNGTLQLAYSTNGISATGNYISAILQAQVYLYSQTGTGGVNAYSFDLHGEIDSMGSDSETSKN